MFARTASCDVTPRDRQLCLAGYSSRKAPVSTILDPIEISALLLECAEYRCLIFSFDLMIVGAELQNIILTRLQQRGFRPDEVILLASHTHYAPATDQACKNLGVPEVEFVNDVAKAADNLVHQILRKQRSEVTVDVFQGTLNHSINRRRYWPFPTIGRTYGFRLTSVSFAPNPSGPKDEVATVTLLKKTDDGHVLGLIWHYTCHPTAVVPENVISSDYPGAVRRALRKHFGDIPCVFAQGFCGDIRPNIRASAKSVGLRKRLHKIVRTMVSGPMFAVPSAKDSTSWTQSLAAGVCEIAQGDPAKTFSPKSLQTGAAKIPLSDFFRGSAPEKMLTAQVVRIGNGLEIVALSAEASVGWERILDRAVPIPSGLTRLYVGYLGALYGYLPTAAQVSEGGYEVEGFQPLFGLSGRFESSKVGPAVAGCIKGALEDLDRAKEPAPLPAQ